MLFRAYTGLAPAIAAAFLIVGCPGPAPAPPSDAGPRDAARRDSGDSGPPADAGDGGGTDSNVDGDLPDGGIDPGSCAFIAADDLYELATDSTDRPRLVSVATTPTGFAVAYATFSVGFQEVWMAAIPSSGPPGGSLQLTMDLATSLEPAIAWGGSSWLVSWFSNRDGAFEIYARGFGLDFRPTGPRQRLTNDAIREDNPAMAALADGSRIAWVAQAVDGTRTASTAALTSLGALVAPAVPVTAAGLRPTAPVLVQRMGGYALAWGDPSGDAVIVPLDMSGTASTPVVLSSEHTADGSVDLTLGLAGGVAVFGTLQGGIRPEIHAVPLDETAAIAGGERSLSIGMQTGRDASVTSLLGGYAVSYRALDTNMLRVVFLSLTLDEVARLDLVSVTPDGGRTTIRASGDGALLIGWADRVSATEVRLRAARIRCN